MEPSYDQSGCLMQVRGNFAFGRSASLTKWNDQLYLHINDNSKCWDNIYKKFDKTRSKAISIRWEHAENLRDCLNEMGTYISQFRSEQVYIYFILNVLR